MPPESGQSSTSSYELAQVSNARQRNATRLPGWQNPSASEPLGGFISNRHGPKLESDVLISIADSFLEFDLISLELCDLSSEIGTALANGNDHQAAINRQEIAAIREELSLIQSGQLQSHRDVLKNQVLVGYTGKSLSLWSLQGFDDNTFVQRRISDGVPDMLSKVRNVPDRLVVAAHQGLLDLEVHAVLRRRWDKIEGVIYTRRGRMSSHLLKRYSSWEVLMATDKNDSSTSGKEKITRIENSRLIWLNTFLWATFASNICLTIPFVLKAYQFSPHTPGTREDPDFWFLAQSSINQSVVLLISALGLWKLKSTHLWVWLPAVMAVVCNMLAMPMYLFAPTEWSSFCVVVAGAIQSFMVLQLAIAGH